MFKHHIRVLPNRVKRGYGAKYTFWLFKRHIRVLPDREKRGYGVNILFGSKPRNISTLFPDEHYPKLKGFN